MFRWEERGGLKVAQPDLGISGVKQGGARMVLLYTWARLCLGLGAAYLRNSDKGCPLLWGWEPVIPPATHRVAQPSW